MNHTIHVVVAYAKLMIDEQIYLRKIDEIFVIFDAYTFCMSFRY